MKKISLDSAMNLIGRISMTDWSNCNNTPFSSLGHSGSYLRKLLIEDGHLEVDNPTCAGRKAMYKRLSTESVISKFLISKGYLPRNDVYEVGQVVYALHPYGWLQGVITKVQGDLIIVQNSLHRLRRNSRTVYRSEAECIRAYNNMTS